MQTLFGIKHHMTQTWDETGIRRSVTVISTPPLTVTRVKTPASDGYTAIQVGYGQPQHLREVRLESDSKLEKGALIKPEDILKIGDLVSVAGFSKGRGFTGVVKRYGFKGGPRTHGQSDRERAPGAIGQGTSPGRIHKGKRMAGHSGNTRFTVKNLSVLKLDPPTHTLWLAGPVPGHRGSLLIINKLSKLA